MGIFGVNDKKYVFQTGFMRSSCHPSLIREFTRTCIIDMVIHDRESCVYGLGMTRTNLNSHTTETVKEDWTREFAQRG